MSVFLGGQFPDFCQAKSRRPPLPRSIQICAFRISLTIHRLVGALVEAPELADASLTQPWKCRINHSGVGGMEMAGRYGDFVERGWRYLLDGTFREVWEACRQKDRSPSDALWDFDKNCFRTLRSETFFTRKIDYYKDLVKDHEEWSKFELENINFFFHDDIKLFPFEDSSNSLGQPGNQTIVFQPPNRFFRVQQDMIERRFPAGRNRTPGDADLKDYIETLRYIFSKNFMDLIFRRRWIAALSALSNFAALAFYLFICTLCWLFVVNIREMNFQYFDFAIISFFMVLLLLTLNFFKSDALYKIKTCKDQYEAAMRSSGILLGRNLQIRQQEIIGLIPLIFSEADNDKFVMKADGRLEKWPEEVRKWTKLAFWMAGRVEYNEFTVQLHMWRIRRHHFGMKWVGTLITRIMKMLARAVLIFIYAGFLLICLTAGGIPETELISRVILISVGLVANVATWRFSLQVIDGSDRLFNSDLDLIKNSIITENIQGHKDVALHDQVAQQLFREKSALLHEEDKGKR